MQTVPRPQDLLDLSTTDIASLELVFRLQFIDIAKIIELFDSKKSQEFVQMNKAYLSEHQKGGHSHHAGCNHSYTSKYFIPRDRMTTVDKIIDDKLFQTTTFFKENNYANMHAILNQINQAMIAIVQQSV